MNSQDQTPLSNLNIQDKMNTYISPMVPTQCSYPQQYQLFSEDLYNNNYSQFNYPNQNCLPQQSYPFSNSYNNNYNIYQNQQFQNQFQQPLNQFQYNFNQMQMYQNEFNLNSSYNNNYIYPQVQQQQQQFINQPTVSQNKLNQSQQKPITLNQSCNMSVTNELQQNIQLQHLSNPQSEDATTSQIVKSNSSENNVDNVKEEKKQQIVITQKIESTVPLFFKSINWIEEYCQQNKKIARILDYPNNQLEENEIFELKDPNKTMRDFDFLTNLEHKKNFSEYKIHNMPHLLYNKILNQLNQQNLELLQLPTRLKKVLTDILNEVTNYNIVCPQKSDKDKLKKVYVYNHTHYNILFLTLTQSSIAQMLSLKNKTDIEFHLSVYGIDLTKNFEDLSVQQLQYINFIKRCMYILTNKYLAKTNIKNNLEKYEKYQQKALESIRILNSGNLIIRF